MKIRTAILGYGRSENSMHAKAVAHNSHAFEMAAMCHVVPDKPIPPDVTNKDEAKYDAPGLTFVGHEYSVSRDVDQYRKEEPALAKNTGCPISEGKVDPSIFADVGGYRIFACCKGCISKIKAVAAATCR